MRVAEVMTPTVVVAQAWQTVAEVLRLMERHQIEHVPVFAGMQVRGVVSSRDLSTFVGLGGGAMDRGWVDHLLLDDFLLGSRRGRMTMVSPRATLTEARRLLADGHDCLVVGSRADGILGIVTATDLVGLDDDEGERDGERKDTTRRARSVGRSGRALPRVRANLEGYEFVTDQPQRVSLFDISAGGARLVSRHRPPRLGDVVALAFRLPKERRPLWSSARVVRVLPSTKPEELAAHAVAFVAMSAADSGRLAGYLADRLGRPTSVYIRH